MTPGAALQSRCLDGDESLITGGDGGASDDDTRDGGDKGEDDDDGDYDDA